MLKTLSSIISINESTMSDSCENDNLWTLYSLYHQCIKP